MNKATVTTGGNVKEKRVRPWAVSFIVASHVLGLVLFSMATLGLAEAKTFVVNSTLDETDLNIGDGICASTPSGKCTLRAAIQEANVFAGPDVIKLKAGIYVITIPGISENACATGDLDVTDDLTIIGTGAKDTFVNGGKLDRVFHIMDGSVTITDVTIQNGLAKEDGTGWLDHPRGGGILSVGALVLKGVNVSNNAAAGGVANYGGGIYQWSGALTITKSTLSKSTISNNAASGGHEAWGGGIYNSGFLVIKGSTLTNNTASSAPNCTAGGIFNEGPLRITGSTISNNFASANSGGLSRGGGIFITSGDGMITQSIISNNAASGGDEAWGGGIWNDGYLQITGTKISNNVARGNTFGYGGGIRCYGFGSHVRTYGSTVSGNAASGRLSMGYGGGIYVGGGELSVQNAGKIIRNFSSDVGGGISFAPGGYGWISPDSTVTKNIPDNIYEGI